MFQLHSLLIPGLRGPYAETLPAISDSGPEITRPRNFQLSKFSYASENLEKTREGLGEEIELRKGAGVFLAVSEANGNSSAK